MKYNFAWECHVLHAADAKRDNTTRPVCVASLRIYTEDLIYMDKFAHDHFARGLDEHLKNHFSSTDGFVMRTFNQSTKREEEPLGIVQIA